MLDSLQELEIAYNLVKSADGNNVIDGLYDQLKTEIDILDCNSEEYNIIQEYVKNSHGSSHSNYELEILNIFTAKREEEKERYRLFEELHNRKLLWHGSRINNFAGILSQGLRIAPAEARHSGNMFGDGIYFADVVSKSVNYCRPNINNNIVLVLLCEVALGEVHLYFFFTYIHTLISYFI